MDPGWRRGATQGPLGTHMVHAALRQCCSTRFRRIAGTGWDICASTLIQGPLTDDQRNSRSKRSPRGCASGTSRRTFTEQLDKAKAMGAIALFGESTDEGGGGEAGPSLELWRHPCESVQIGPVTILGESSIGPARRVGGLRGRDSLCRLAKERVDNGLVTEGAVRRGTARVANLVEGGPPRRNSNVSRMASARQLPPMPPPGLSGIGNVRLRRSEVRRDGRGRPAVVDDTRQAG